MGSRHGERVGGGRWGCSASTGSVGLEGRDGTRGDVLLGNESVSQRGGLRDDLADSAWRDSDSGQHRGGPWEGKLKGIDPVPSYREDLPLQRAPSTVSSPMLKA